MSDATYDVDPRLKIFYEGLGAQHERFTPLLIAILSAEYRDKILKEGMDPNYALQEAIRVGEFRIQHAKPPNVPPMSFQQATAMSQPIQDVKAMNEKYILDDLERKADIFIDSTNKQFAKQALEDLNGQTHASKYNNYPLQDQADRIAVVAADAVEDHVGGNILWNMDGGDRRDLVQYLATVVREGYNMPAPPPVPTQNAYEQAAGFKSPSATWNAACDILKDLKDRRGIRQAFDDIDPEVQVQILTRMDELIRNRFDVTGVATREIAELREVMMEPEEPQLTPHQERISELWWAKVDQMKDDIDRGDRLINAHAASLLNRVLEGSKSFDVAWVEFESFAEERQGAKRYAEQVTYFDVAHEWANKPGITPLEAAHGVAKTLYIEKHQVIGSLENISREYNEVFDYNYAEQIKLRQVRAAKELFGS